MILKFDPARPKATCRKPASVAVTETAQRLDRLERNGGNLSAILYLMERQEQRIAERAAAR